MKSRDEVVTLAEAYAGEGFLCSEAVLWALSRALEIDSELIPKIATGFGAGIGRTSHVCGAAAGAVMGLGLRFGRSEIEELPEGRRPYWYATEFIDRFREEHGSTTCAGLTGLDLSEPGAIDTYNERSLWETLCRDLIGEATALAYDILDSEG